MRRLFGVVLAGATLILPAFSQNAFAQQAPAAPAQQTPAAAPAQAAPQKFTLEGDIALWSVAIKADKTADYEQVLAKLKEALTMSTKPEAKQQMAGWKVMRGVKNPATGDIIYTHIITPVPGADYATMQTIYDAITDPMVRTQIYELYRGAFSQNLGVNSGSIVADFSK
jgi:hypothetical protein